MKPIKMNISDLILETVPEGIAWKDLDAVYQGCNMIFAKAAGFSTQKDIIGKTDQDLSWHDSAETYLITERQVIETKKPLIKMVEFYHRKETNDLWLEVSIFPLFDDLNDVVGLLNIFHDISEDMKIKQDLRAAKSNLEQKIDERTKELSRARNEAIEAKNHAEDASKAKSQFLSSMSHELRTPLNAILGFSQLMQMDFEETYHSPSEDINEILKAGNHLLHLINDVLDLAKIEVGGLTLSLESVEVQTVIEECFKLSSTLALDHNISLIGKHDSNNDLLSACENTLVKADRLRLKQVILNLITNAIKYNTDGGSVIVSCQDIELNIVRICVEDTGKGIQKSQQKKLFKAFERLDAEKEGIDGTGIGLVLSKNLIEQMNGSIHFESQPGAGSQFWIELPKVTINTKSNEENIEIRVLSNQNTNKTVLYVEDNPSNLFVMTKIFKHRFPHWILEAAKESISGLKMAKDLQPDLILLDINLPNMDGYEVLKRLKQSILTRHIPVVAVTAHAMSTDIDKSKGLGFADYITKPIDINVLIKSIDTIFPEDY